MIRMLMEIQIAHDSKTQEDSIVDSHDTHYLQLNCGIDVSCIIIHLGLILVSNMMYHKYYMFYYFFFFRY